jgi:hypothetical protein
LSFEQRHQGEKKNDNNKRGRLRANGMRVSRKSKNTKIDGNP